MTLIFVTAKTTNNKPSHDIYPKELGGLTSSDSQLHTLIDTALTLPVLLVALNVNNWAGGVIPVERWRGYDLVYNLRLVPWTFKTTLLSVAYSWLHYVFCSRKLLDVWKATCCPCYISRPTRNTWVANCVCFHKILHSVRTRKVCPVYWRNCFETAICGTFSAQPSFIILTHPTFYCCGDDHEENESVEELANDSARSQRLTEDLTNGSA